MRLFCKEFSCYRPQRSCGQGYVLTRVCDSVHRRGLWADPPRQGEPPPQDQANHPPPRTRQPPPPGPGRPPPPSRETPRDQADHIPPGPGRHPPARETLLDQADTPPPGKQTAAYGQWAAGTHSTGMHSCCLCGAKSPSRLLLSIEQTKRSVDQNWNLYGELFIISKTSRPNHTSYANHGVLMVWKLTKNTHFPFINRQIQSSSNAVGIMIYNNECFYTSCA